MGSGVPKAQSPESNPGVAQKRGDPHGMYYNLEHAFVVLAVDQLVPAA